jgi:V/A-type H+/Na+-transporting ATPase subunit K
MTRSQRWIVALMGAGGILFVVSLGVLVASGRALAQAEITAVDPRVLQSAFLSAALAVAASALAAGYAVARVGSAAVGAIAEKPELMGRALILVGLAEGIAIYGLIIAILILNRVG